MNDADDSPKRLSCKATEMQAGDAAGIRGCIFGMVY